MKSFKRVASQVREHWVNLVNNAHRRMSRGAEYINKCITCAHKDQWRKHMRGREQKKK
jgi:hypothetical protein